MAWKLTVERTAEWWFGTLTERDFDTDRLDWAAVVIGKLVIGIERVEPTALIPL